MSGAAFRRLDDIDVKGKRVLVRLDLNVPMKNGKVADSLRLERQAPTVRELAEKGARVIVLSHFDRPKGKRVESMSLAPVAPALAEAIGRPVAFAGPAWAWHLTPDDYLRPCDSKPRPAGFLAHRAAAP